jgi:malonyl-CoA/methylmalonyl-CoA synthetase
MTLAELFAPTFRDRARATALEWACQEFTFQDLDARASRMAATLAARGLTRGDRLAVYLPNRLEYIDLFLATSRLGVIFVPINILYRGREASHILADASPKALVLSGESPAASIAPLWQIDVLAAEAGHRAPVPPVALEAQAPAALVYTSGTTGTAKGALITHANLGANARALVAAWRITDRDRLLHALPLFHVHGLGNGLHCWLLSGCRTRLLERFDHQSAAATFLDFRPTVFFGVPTMYVRMLQIEEAAAHKIGSALRLCVSGSAPLPAQVLEEFDSRFGQRILERYGMTETLMTLSNPYEGERRAGTVGAPLPGVEVRILDQDGRDVEDGTIGELHVRAATVCAGYWNRPDETAAAFRGEWFRTGDLATRSPDGYYTLHGRSTDLIISGGFNIYPREIEDLLTEHPAVAEAAVAGVPDPLRGEVAVAFVVLRDGMESNDEVLTDFCRSHLASFKVPRTVRVVARLPRTALGKVVKSMLVEGYRRDA